MKDFVAEVAGQTILRLVSRGNAIIAELLRLSSHIPPVFFLNAPEHRRYESILFDFKYLQNQDYCESKIEDSAVSYFYLAHYYPFPYTLLTRLFLLHNFILPSTWFIYHCFFFFFSTAVIHNKYLLLFFYKGIGGIGLWVPWESPGNLETFLSPFWEHL